MRNFLFTLFFLAFFASPLPAFAGQTNDYDWYEEALYLADNRYEELSPAQKKRIEKQREKFNKLPPEEQERIKKAREEYKKLPPDEKKKLKEKWKKKKKKS